MPPRRRRLARARSGPRLHRPRRLDRARRRRLHGRGPDGRRRRRAGRTSARRRSSAAASAPTSRCCIAGARPPAVRGAILRRRSRPGRRRPSARRPSIRRRPSTSDAPARPTRSPCSSCRATSGRPTTPPSFAAPGHAAVGARRPDRGVRPRGGRRGSRRWPTSSGPSTRPSRKPSPSTPVRAEAGAPPGRRSGPGCTRRTTHGRLQASPPRASTTNSHHGGSRGRTAAGSPAPASG